MILGMVANYLWDSFRAGKSFVDIKLPELLIPLLVSPIIFMGSTHCGRTRKSHLP